MFWRKGSDGQAEADLAPTVAERVAEEMVARGLMDVSRTPHGVYGEIAEKVGSTHHSVAWWAPRIRRHGGADGAIEEVNRLNRERFREGSAARKRERGREQGSERGHEGIRGRLSRLLGQRDG